MPIGIEVGSPYQRCRSIRRRFGLLSLLKLDPHASVATSYRDDSLEATIRELLRRVRGWAEETVIRAQPDRRFGTRVREVGLTRRLSERWMFVREWVLRIVAWAGLGLAGCSDTFYDRFGNVFLAALINSPVDRVCGGGLLAPLIPDCPIEGVCFVTACENHDQCYLTCGETKIACDIKFYAGMVSACIDSLGLEHPNLKPCLGFASVYWSAVDRLGQEAFNDTQVNGGCVPDGGVLEPGACCTGGQPAFCNPVGDGSECPFDSVFIPGLTCEEVDQTLGGCPTPLNDDCAERKPVCEGRESDATLGYCTRNATNELPVRVCSVSSQDCPFGDTCVPLKDTAFRCRVELDNRLATTDGPAAAGDCEASGIESFQADVWFEYVVPCSGTLSIDMCERTDFDSMLAVYGSTVESGCVCPSDGAALLSCNDDFCSGFSSPSGVTVFNVVEGGCYLIRVGGWSNEGSGIDARRGIGELDIGVLCDPVDGDTTAPANP